MSYNFFFYRNNIKSYKMYELFCTVFTKKTCLVQKSSKYLNILIDCGKYVALPYFKKTISINNTIILIKYININQ